MSTPAITNGMCFHQHHDAVLIKQAMFRPAKQGIFHVDHTKFGQRALHAHYRVTDCDTVIVDSGADPSDILGLRDWQVEVLIAPTVTDVPQRP